jgi:hypothetical protein
MSAWWAVSRINRNTGLMNSVGRRLYPETYPGTQWTYPGPDPGMLQTVPFRDENWAQIDMHVEQQIEALARTAHLLAQAVKLGEMI